MTEALQSARELAQAKRYREAEAVLHSILHAAPNDARALHLLASIAEVEGDLNRAARFLRQAADANPRDFIVNAHLCTVFRRLGQIDGSVVYGRRAAELRPNDPVILNDLALAYMDRGDYAAAEACLSRALELRPDFAEPHNNMGLIAQRAGRLPEAVSWFEKFLRLNPGGAHAYVNLLDSYTVRDAADPHIREIDRRLAGRVDDNERMLLLFAKTKAYVDLGRNREALELAIRACELKRRSIHFDEAGMMKYFRDIQTVFSPEFISRARESGGVRNSRPIFIISMPRAGSTLVEQILSSHPSVYGAGELFELSNALAQEQLRDPNFLRVNAAAAFTRIAEAYLRGVTARAPGVAHFTDKMPTNFFLTGLIHVALPDARIIHVSRSPVDTCVSCFMRHFSSDLNHTYDLAELGRYYRAYRQLMDHWRVTLPPDAMLEVRYEDLIEDIEAGSRRLLTYCGLPWDDAVLRFHESRRPVATASLSQVRQPLYRSSMARWRGCEDLLAPLLRELGDLADQPRPR